MFREIRATWAGYMSMFVRILVQTLLETADSVEIVTQPQHEL